MRKIVLIGATGSIGRSTLEVLRHHPDKLRLVGVASQANATALAQIAAEFSTPHTVLTQRDGNQALIDLATLPEADCVLVAATGTVGVGPTIAALAAGKTVALASKEVLVLGGAFVMEQVAKGPGCLLPVDSEHSALFQCLSGLTPGKSVKRLILTASGGAFRERPLDTLDHVTPADAMRHPTWSMGPKITVDSATMANKGLELIEAHWLFGLPSSQIDVLLHPQSTVHGLVEYVDGTVLAQLSPPSMTFAIQAALLYPERIAGPQRGLDFKQTLRLDFAPLDPRRYPCFAHARAALDAGGTAPTVFNAANEVTVGAFLEGRLPFTGIAPLIARTLDSLPARPVRTLEDALAAEAEALAKAREAVAEFCSRS